MDRSPPGDMRGKLRLELGRLANVLGFLSRIPLPPGLFDERAKPERLDEAAIWFPVAGLLIGIFPATTYFIAANILPATFAAGLAVATGMLVTGSLHEDGLSDCADGLGGTRDKQKALDIMRDSRIGTYGAAALVFSLGLRWAALATLSPEAGVAALLISHAAARGSITTALSFSYYARPHGAASVVERGIARDQWAMVIAISLLLSFLFGGWWGGLATIGGFAVAALFLSFFARRIGGYTGDALGGMEQLSEITILAVLSSGWAPG